MVRSSGLERIPSPAILPRKSTRPNSESTRLKSSAMASGLETSVFSTIARRPCRRTSLAVASAPSRFRSTSTRSAPASDKARAVARPMPWAAPETTATRPVRSKSLIWFFLGKFSFRRVCDKIITKKESQQQGPLLGLLVIATSGNLNLSWNFHESSTRSCLLVRNAVSNLS